MNKLQQETIILASQSPRRRELLEQMGLDIEICPARIDETNGRNLSPRDLVEILSRTKAGMVTAIRPDAWVIGADTVVVVDGMILGKPGSQKETVHMLDQLNGREHSVFTGFTVGCGRKRQAVFRTVETRVRFKSMTQKEILWYAGTPEPYDKAGGYGIQGAGGFMVESITGSYSNVVGLPLCEVMETLKELGAVRF